MSDILTIANLSKLAYKGSDFFKKTINYNKFDSRLKSYGFENAKKLKFDDTFAFIVRKENKTFLIFRGSANIKNITGKDLNFGSVKLNNGKVYEGFYLAAKQIYPLIKRYLNKKDNIYVGGHSLGSAMAHITANTLFEDGYKINCCVGIGSPRIGKRKYINNTKNYFPRWEIINNLDIIGEIPSAILGWKHYRTLYIDKKGNIKENVSFIKRKIDRLVTLISNRRASELIKDHRSQLYCEILEKKKFMLEKYENWR